MAEPDLIQAYLAQLHRCLGRRQDAADDVAEAADHLWEAAENFERAGMDPTLAQRLALERFGEPIAVARALSITSNGGAAMPTNSTRAAGTAAVVAAACWLAAILVSVLLNVLLNASDSSLPAYLLFAVVVGVASVATVVAPAGLNARAGGRRDPWTLAAVGLALVAALALVLVTWAWLLWVQLLAASALMIVLRLRSAHVRSSISDLLLVAAWPLALLTFVVAERMRLGDVDTFGDYPAAATAGLTVGAVLFAAGLLPVGRWLQSEPVVEVAAPLPAG